MALRVITVQIVCAVFGNTCPKCIQYFLMIYFCRKKNQKTICRSSRRVFHEIVPIPEGSDCSSASDDDLYLPNNDDMLVYIYMTDNNE